MTQVRERYRTPESTEYIYVFERDGDDYSFETFSDIRKDAGMAWCEVVSEHNDGVMARAVVAADERWKLEILVSWHFLGGGMSREDIREELKAIQKI